MATLSDYNGQETFTIGGNSFSNRASSGTPIYERIASGDGGSGSFGGLIDHLEVRSSCTGPGRNSYCQYTWPDWDADTQIILCMTQGGREVPISPNIFGALSIGGNLGKVWMYPDASDPTKGNGIMQVQDDISGSGDVGGYFWRLYRAPGTYVGIIE